MVWFKAASGLYRNMKQDFAIKGHYQVIRVGHYVYSISFGYKWDAMSYATKMSGKKIVKLSEIGP